MKNIFKGIKTKWNNYLKKLTKVNQELYGNKKLNCCDLNKKQDLKDKH